MLRQRCQWLEECLAISKTSITTNNEEAFQNALLGDLPINKEVPHSLPVVRSEFPTQIRLCKAIAYENYHGSWLSAAMASMSLHHSGKAALAVWSYREWKNRLVATGRRERRLHLCL